MSDAGKVGNTGPQNGGKQADRPDNSYIGGVLLTPTTPLRLKVAAALAFPDGSMSEKALWEMGHAGKLTVEVIRGKLYTTLADIEEMRSLCRVQAKVPEFLLLPARKGHEAGYVIRDSVNGRRVEKPCEGDGKTDLAEAQKQLAAYITGKHDPEAGRKGDANRVILADAISVYTTKHVEKKAARPNATKKCLSNILEKLGHLKIGEIDGVVQEEYADNRADEVAAAWAAKGKQKDADECYSAPRRELETMAAAINFYAKHSRGGVQAIFRPVLPDPNPAHTRWLTRSEAAKLVWTAWRMREDRSNDDDATLYGKVGHNSRMAGEGRRTGKHIARLILIGLYTGTRKSPMIEAALLPTIGRPYVDLERGVFQRLALAQAREQQAAAHGPDPAEAVDAHAPMEAARHLQSLGDRVAGQRHQGHCA